MTPERVAVAVASARDRAVERPVSTLEHARALLVEIAVSLSVRGIDREERALRRVVLADAVRLVETLDARSRRRRHTCAGDLLAALNAQLALKDAVLSNGPKALRLSLVDGRTARALASEIGVNESTISAWCNRRKVPGQRSRAELHRILGIDPRIWELPDEASRAG